jgi:tRNA pseudouridine55 synthase
MSALLRFSKNPANQQAQNIRLDSMFGIINLDKPAGISSAKAVAIVKRRLPRGTKIGHAGTLDPFATGVLLLLIGKATKCCEQLMNLPKQYDATLLLGSTTITDDPESPEIPWPALAPSDAPPTNAHIHLITNQFVGQIEQQPPAYSAIHVNGKRAYDLARHGKTVELRPRTVHIYAVEVIDYSWPILKLRVDCGRGTYIRALARDLGAALNVGGHLTALRRTKVGPFAVENGKNLEDISPDKLPILSAF